MVESVSAAPRGAASTTAAQPVIGVTDLTKTYGSFEAVKGISFEIAEGEIVALLGPNGAGKTTTVEILEGFRQRSGGSVRVLGEDPQSAPRLWRDRIGVVLQESEIEPRLTARECLELYAGYHLHPRPVAETLDLVGLGAKANSRGAALSGGQRRRLDVALALIGDPELVFLDEPTTGFDPSARRQAWEVVSDLRSLGKTILLTTHYMDEAEYLADRILVIARGVIVAEGTPATLGGRDAQPAAVTFVIDRQLDASAFGDLQFEPVPTERDRTYSFTTQSPVPAVVALAGWAESHGAEVVDLIVRRPSLEDVYLELTTESSNVKEKR